MILSRLRFVSKVYPTTVQKMSNLTSVPPKTPNIMLKTAPQSEDDVLFKIDNNKGIIILNRPKALNALNLSMVDKILPTLQKWQNDKMLVIIKGAGEKSFCAGGDVRAVTENGPKGLQYGLEFFRKEYTMNGLLGSYDAPVISFVDGIVMGGGVGISVHGRYRVATEKTLFAMPETAIGLFPDVGGSHFLPRLEGKLGVYLALTGHRLKGMDVYRAGIATHYCESRDVEKIEDALLQCTDVHNVKHILDELCPIKEHRFSLEPHMAKINQFFALPTVESILQSLEKDDSEWSRNTLQILSKMSPTSLKVSLKELQLGAKMNLQDCLKMEFRIVLACLANKDFYEGVRAQLIDRDQNPIWSPRTLEEVTDEIVDSYFKKLPENQELKHKL